MIIVFLFRRELLHSYGFEHMGTLNNLEKAGLLRKQVPIFHFFIFLIFICIADLFI